MTPDSIRCDPAEWMPSRWGIPRQRDLVGGARMRWLTEQIAKQGGWKGKRNLK